VRGAAGRWPVWGLILLMAALLLGPTGATIGCAAMEESIARSSEAFIATRAFEAVLSELRSVGVGGAVVTGTVAPFAGWSRCGRWRAHGVLAVHCAMVQGVLRLFADVAAHGAFLAAALCMLFAGWAGYRRCLAPLLAAHRCVWSACGWWCRLRSLDCGAVRRQPQDGRGQPSHPPSSSAHGGLAASDVKMASCRDVQKRRGLSASSK
jgi:hypothetical protein